MNTNALLEENRREPGLFRYKRLRWFAVVVAAIITLAAQFGFGFALPWPLLIALLIFVLLGNLALYSLKDVCDRHPQWTLMSLLVLDLIVFTTLLYFTGGAHNPFTIFYLLFVTVAIFLLPSFGGWIMVAASTLAFSLLFTSRHELVHEAMNHGAHGMMSNHLQGMVIALFVTASGIVFFVSSVSRDHRRRKEVLEQMSQKIQEAQRMSGLANLAASIAHEMATPLGTIAIVSRDLAQQTCEGDRNQQCKADARLIREEVDRCREVLLKLGERTGETGEEPCEVIRPALLRAELPLFLQKAYADRIVWKCEKDLPALWLPPHGFFSALSVLVKNAFEASHPDQEVEIAWRHSAARGSTLTVSDQGEGIPEEQVRQLGTPFFTTKAPGTGMGLGLFLTRTFCEKYGGSLGFDSVPGKGTSARMFFPASAHAKSND